MPPFEGAKVQLGGLQRTLRYTSRSLARAEDELGGVPLASIVASVGMVSIRHVSVMVWAGRLFEDPDLSLEDVYDLIEPPLAPLIAAITEGLGPWMTVTDNGQGSDEGETPEKGGPTSEVG